MKEAVIVGYRRSPFHFANKGALDQGPARTISTAAVVKSLIAKTGVEAKDIEDLLLGCAFPEGEQGFNVARLIGLIADLPQSVAGATINRFCGSSMQGIHMWRRAPSPWGRATRSCAAASKARRRVPMLGFNPMPNPALNERLPAAYISMGTTAENVATNTRSAARAGSLRGRQPEQGECGACRRQVERRDRRRSRPARNWSAKTAPSATARPGSLGRFEAGLRCQRIRSPPAPLRR